MADPAIWNRQTGESVAEIAERFGVYFERGDNERLAGIAQIHERLKWREDGRPRMYVFNTCRDFIRTLPALVYDERKVEDVNTDGEDHIFDECKYFCMSMPIAATPVKHPDTWYQNPMYRYLDIKRGDLTNGR